jgi:hypothetical protein
MYYHFIGGFMHRLNGWQERLDELQLSGQSGYIAVKNDKIIDVVYTDKHGYAIDGEEIFTFGNCEPYWVPESQCEDDDDFNDGEAAYNEAADRQQDDRDDKEYSF